MDNDTTTTNQLECIEHDPARPADNGACTGPVEHRTALSGTGVSYPRCASHWEARLDRESEIRERYPDHPPADWSPGDAGEAWYEDE